MVLYFFSGLGADKRVFKKLRLPEHAEIRHVEWIQPEPEELLENYVRRLAAVITTDKPFCLIGLSFGGIIATEISKFLYPAKTILISSVSSKHELPFYFTFLKYLKLHLLLSEKRLKKKNKLFYWMMGASNLREKALLNQIVKATDIVFFKWAINCILNWEQKYPLKNTFQIHGTKDFIFPVHNIKQAHKINHGGHLMVYKQADEVSALLIDLLAL